MKRVVRKKFAKIPPRTRQTLLVLGGVLLFFAVSMFLKQAPCPAPLREVQKLVSSSMQLDAHRWQDRQGWWGGYWWGNKDFYWKGREWGLGKSVYPWYWEYDSLAKELNLVALAKRGQWCAVRTAIFNKINELQTELRDTENKASRRKLERTIDRLEYYLYEARNYYQAS